MNIINKNIDKEIKKIERKISKTNLDNLESLQKQLNLLKIDINKIQDAIENPNKYFNLEKLNKDDKSFEQLLTRIEIIKNTYDKKLDDNAKLMLYLELNYIINWCDEYIKSKNMKIINIE